MQFQFNNAQIYHKGCFVTKDISLDVRVPQETFSVPADHCFLFPGFVDVHVHLREPGFFYKETILTGTQAAAHGGYTEVCSMPNLNPVPDTPAHLEEQLSIIRKDAKIGVHPYASITVGQKGEKLTDFAALAPNCIAFSDDGKGVQNDEIMREAMLRAKALNKMIVAHCEVNALLKGGYIHDGAYARAHGHKGICSESEWRQIERDLKLARETGCAYHVCHISTKESVALIRRAKREGVDVTCETGPHYLLLNDEMLREDGRFKMNPPLRSEADRQALLEGIADGTIDMIATDHAPHSTEEKSRGLVGSAMGIVGLETAFPLLYTRLVKPGFLSLEKLVALMSENPRKRFGLPKTQNLCVWDLNTQYNIDPVDFLSKGKATPFTGETVFGRCLLTVYNGAAAYRDPRYTKQN